MQGETLMLDQGYRPIDRKSWQEVMVDWANDKIEIVATYPDRRIHDRLELYMPAVARFLHGFSAKKTGIKFSRDNVYARDRGSCQYCGHHVPREDITYDHVVPRDQGGKTNWTNVVICCHGCNQRKRNMSPEQAGMRLRFGSPKKPRSLPPRPDRRFVWRDGMPESWRPYLMSKDEYASSVYWHSSLKEEL